MFKRMKTDMTIRIGLKWDKDAVYIGRGSPLGNPFIMRNEQDRERVCDAYEDWFNNKVKENYAPVMQELRRIYKIHKQGDVILGCYCYPKRCHGETIKRFLDRYI